MLMSRIACAFSSHSVLFHPSFLLVTQKACLKSFSPHRPVLYLGKAIWCHYSGWEFVVICEDSRHI